MRAVPRRKEDGTEILRRTEFFITNGTAPTCPIRDNFRFDILKLSCWDEMARPHREAGQSPGYEAARTGDTEDANSVLTPPVCFQFFHPVRDKERAVLWPEILQR